MKHKNNLLMAFVWFAFLVACIVPASAAVQIGDLYYTLNESALTASVAAHPNGGNAYNISNLTIPSKVSYEEKEYTVIAIENQAFYGNQNTRSITFPNTLKTIGTSAFWWNPNVKDITIPESVTSIGVQAFCQCSNLETVTINGRMSESTRTATQSFAYCPNLKHIIINSSGSTWISSYAFQNCEALETLTINSASLSMICDYAFVGCSKLKNLTTENWPRVIGKFAFQGCTSLSNLNLGSNCVEIDENAFKGCTGLTSVNLPSSMQIVQRSAFADCSNLTNVIFNGGAKIRPSAFSTASSLRSVFINSSTLPIIDADNTANATFFPDHFLKTSTAADKGYIYIKPGLSSARLEAATGWSEMNMPVSNIEIVQTMEWGTGSTINIYKPQTYEYWLEYTPSVTCAISDDDLNAWTNGVVKNSLAFVDWAIGTNAGSSNAQSLRREGSEDVIRIETDPETKVVKVYGVNYGTAELLLNGHNKEQVAAQTVNVEVNTGVKDLDAENGIKVYAVEGCIKVEGAESVIVCDAAGRVVYSGNAGEVSVGSGLYVVKADGKTTKLIVK